MGQFVSKYVPGFMQGTVLNIINNTQLLMRKVIYIGYRFYCPICKSRLRKFKPLLTKDYSRLGAKCCPVCNSMERHRWIWIFLNQKTDLFDGKHKKMLHIAPEKHFTVLFSKIPNLDYLSGDLEPGRGMERIDITDIGFPDKSFDVIFCCHVLEHVPDDLQAMREFYRVLTDDGWALLVVPITGEKTFEDFAVKDSEQRRLVFNHPGHVRICGPDYKDRMISVGFSVTTAAPFDLLNQEQMRRFGLKKQIIFICHKQVR